MTIPKLQMTLFSSVVMYAFFSFPACGQLLPNTAVSPQKGIDAQLDEKTLLERELDEVRAFQEKMDQEDKEDMARLQLLYEKYMPEPPEMPPVEEGGEPPQLPEPPPEFKKEADPLWERMKERREKIIGRFEAFLEKYPQSWLAMDDFANYLYENGDPMRAKELWLKALELKPDSADLHNNIGVYYSHFGEPLQAVDEFRKAIELQPDKAVSYFNLATMYFTSRYKVQEREEWDLPTVYWKSQEAYERAFELDPQNFEYAINCAQNFYMAHFFKVNDVWHKAIKAWKRCLALDLADSQKAFVYTNLGRVYRKMGQFRLAKEHLQKSLDVAVTPVAEHLLKKVTEDAEKEARN